MSLNLVIVRRSNADKLTTVIVGREARAFVAPETELPPAPASKKRAHQSPHQFYPFTKETDLNRVSGLIRHGRRACRVSSLCR